MLPDDKRVFATSNEDLWMNKYDEIHQGICSGMTAVWIQRTIKQKALMSHRQQLMGDVNDYEDLRRFYRSVAGVHATFRNDFIDSEWSARGKMFNRLGLKQSLESSNDVIKNNIKWMLTRPKGGLFFTDIRGQSEGSFFWHTIGFYYDGDDRPLQFFDPNFGLYQWKPGEKIAMLRDVLTALKKQAPDFARYTSVCHHVPFVPS